MPQSLTPLEALELLRKRQQESPADRSTTPDQPAPRTLTPEQALSRLQFPPKPVDFLKQAVSGIEGMERPPTPGLFTGGLGQLFPKPETPNLSAAPLKEQLEQRGPAPQFNLSSLTPLKEAGQGLIKNPKETLRGGAAGALEGANTASLIAALTPVPGVNTAGRIGMGIFGTEGMVEGVLNKDLGQFIGGGLEASLAPGAGKVFDVVGAAGRGAVGALPKAPPIVKTVTQAATDLVEKAGAGVVGAAKKGAAAVGKVIPHNRQLAMVKKWKAAQNAMTDRQFLAQLDDAERALMVEKAGQFQTATITKANPKGIDFFSLPRTIQDRTNRLWVSTRRLTDDVQTLAKSMGQQYDDAARLAIRPIFEQANMARSLGLKATVGPKGGLRLPKGLTNVKEFKALQLQKAVDKAGLAITEMIFKVGGAGLGGAALGGTATADALTTLPGQEPRSAMEEFAMIAGGSAVGMGAGLFGGKKLAKHVAARFPRVFDAIKQRAQRMSLQGVTDVVADATFFSVLSSPDTLIRANAGAVGGALLGLTERLVAGLVSGNATKIEQAARGFGALVAESPKIWFKTMSGSLGDVAKLQKSIMGELPGKVPLRETGGLIRQVIASAPTRILTGPDLAAINALKKAGYSVDEATSFTLSGNPLTKVGKDLMSFFDSGKTRAALRGGKAVKEPRPPLSQMTKRQVALFPRIGIRAFEGMGQRTPFLPEIFPALRMGGKVESRLRQLEGPIALKLGMEANELSGRPVEERERQLDKAPFPINQLSPESFDPRMLSVLGPGVGPAVLPFILGENINQARRAGSSVLSAIAATFAEFSPMGRRPLGAIQDLPTEIQRRVIFSIIADIAKATDDAFDRETGATTIKKLERGESILPTFNEMFAKAKARIPSGIPGIPHEFTRESLEETFVPVSAPGGLPKQGSIQRLTSLPKSVEKFFLPPVSQTQMPPTFDRADPLVQQLVEQGIHEMGAPSGRPGVGIGIGTVPLDTPRDARLNRQRVRGEAKTKAVEWTLRMPIWEQMPNSEFKALLMRFTIAAIEEKLRPETLSTTIEDGAQFPPDFFEPR